MRQNASKCVKMRQIASKCIKMRHHVSKWLILVMESQMFGSMAIFESETTSTIESEFPDLFFNL